jgi:hypothetical protein
MRTVNYLDDRSSIDQFISNNNVTLYVDFYSNEHITVLTDKQQIEQFINSINFECEVCEVDFSVRKHYFNLEHNECEMTEIINKIDSSKVYTINSDDRECDCYFVLD